MTVRSGDKYAAILDAAQLVFARQGYHSAQISRIAAEAGVATGTVYLYFKNKPDLLISLFRERLGTLIDQARRLQAGAADPKEKLRRFIWHHFTALSADPDLAMVTQVELRQADAEVRQQISSVMKGYFQVIDEIVQEGRDSGDFRRSPDPRQIRNVIFGTLDQTVTAWVLSGFGFELAALAESTFVLLTGGVCEN